MTDIATLGNLLRLARDTVTNPREGATTVLSFAPARQALWLMFALVVVTSMMMGEIVALLRQRSRPYLFSNTVAPPVVAGAIKALALVDEEPALRERLAGNTARFRDGLERLGFELLPGEHPIVPIMLHDAALAARFADEMLKLGVYVVAFSYPVVPKGKARIRTQMSAALSDDDIDRALDAFGRTRKTLGL